MNYKDWEALIDEDPDDAAKRAAKTLDDDPENPLALFVIATVYSRAERFGIAANIFTRITQLKPDRPEPWNNLGMCWAGLGQTERAREAFLHAWGIQKQSMFAANIGMAYHADRQLDESIKWCTTALELDAESRSAKTTLALTYLALGRWDFGWKYNAYSIGGKFRKNIQYQDEPVWDGSKGKCVAFYGEQGLGDEIMYASCIADAQKDCSEVIVECDSRLKGLFSRSFPGVSVYGTRNRTEVEWPGRHKLDARLAIGQLPEFYRPKPDSCPGTPYLVADPERRVQWRALLNSYGEAKPKIGIAWSGGSKYNKPAARAMGLAAFKNIMMEVDAVWVSLQYKDPTEEIADSGLPVHHWKRACETDDYDDTAALVAELDLVISVPTAVVHMAGSMGVKVHCLTPQEADWSFKCGFPWYKSVKLFWKNAGENWDDFAKRYAQSVHRVRPASAAGVQRPPTLDCQELVGSGVNHAAHPLSATAEAARSYGVHV